MTESLSINTPAVLFPAISLLMLAYTNRFLALASRVRTLHDEYNKNKNAESIKLQIHNIRRRIRMIKNMQALGIVSFLLCMTCMYSIYVEQAMLANILFAASMLAMIASLVISLAEIFISTKALDLELSDMEKDDEGSSLKIFNIFKKDE
jgi:hypothetical protein